MELRKHEINAVALLQYIMMFLVFIFGYSVYVRMMPNNGFVVIPVAFVLTVILLIFKRRKVYNEDIIKCILVTLFIGVYYAVNGSNSSSSATLFRLYLPLIALILYLGQEYRDGDVVTLLKKYSDIVVAFALISIILYFLGTVLGLLPYSYDAYYWRGTTLTAKNYFHLMYEAQRERFFGITMIRNCGIFCEAPAYATPLCLSTAFELFGSEKLNKRRIAILIITVITTWSTKAICIMMSIFLLKMMQISFSREDRKKGFIAVLKLIMPFIIGFIVVIGIAVLNNKMQQHSYLLRIDNLLATMKAFRRHVFFGVGIENEAAIYPFLTVTALYTGLAMGLTTLLAEGGIYLFSLYIYSMVRAIVSAKLNTNVLFFILTFLLILFTSNIPFYLCTTGVLALGLAIPGSLVATGIDSDYFREDEEEETE